MKITDSNIDHIAMLVIKENITDYAWETDDHDRRVMEMGYIVGIMEFAEKLKEALHT